MGHKVVELLTEIGKDEGSREDSGKRDFSFSAYCARASGKYTGGDSKL